jgi:hypothetical protein
MPDIRALRVFGIAGASYLGRTLLGFMLGAHHCVFATGEADQLFRCYLDVSGRNRDIDMCSVHHEACEFWTRNFSAQCEHQNISTLYSRIVAHFDLISVVVHSFNTEVYAELLREGTPLTGLIVLFKRPASYYCSRKGHEGSSVATAAVNYVSRYCEIRDLSESSRLPTATVFYEDLAMHPHKTLQALCAWMGLPYEHIMTTPWEAVDRLHTIGGNVGPYMYLWDENFREQMLNSEYWREAHGERGWLWLRDSFHHIRLDERWKSLPPEEIRAIEACTAARETFETLMASRLLPAFEVGESAPMRSRDK